MDKSASQTYLAHFHNPKKKGTQMDNTFYILCEYFWYVFKQIQLLSRKVDKLGTNFSDLGK